MLDFDSGSVYEDLDLGRGWYARWSFSFSQARILNLVYIDMSKCKTSTSVIIVYVYTNKMNVFCAFPCTG